MSVSAVESGVSPCGTGHIEEIRSEFPNNITFVVHFVVAVVVLVKTYKFPLHSSVIVQLFS